MTHTNEDDLDADITETDLQNGTLLAFKRLNWRAVCEAAPQLTDTHDVADHAHPCTLLQLLDSRCLSRLVDASQTMWPLWVVKLPPTLWPHADKLAMRFPDTINRESDDRLHNHTYYCSLVVPEDRWEDRMQSAWSLLDSGVGYVLFSGFVDSSIDAACVAGGINLLLRAGANSVLASYAMNEDQLVGLQGAGINSGPNWRPYRIYEEEEMAAVASRGTGGDAYVLGTLAAGQHSCAVIS